METLEDQLIRHEGYRQFPYKCSAGVWTVAIGRNLDDRGISEDEARYMLHNDIKSCKKEINFSFPVVKTLNNARCNVLINMCFNIGIGRLRGFKKMWAAIEDKNFNEAARQMLDSKWATQVGIRAKELSESMRMGI